MANTIMKQDKETDFYLVFSSIVEAIIVTGTRQDILAWSADAAPRLERADETGTSAVWVTQANLTWEDGTPMPEWGSWTDDSYIYEQRGTMTRANLFVAAHRLNENQKADLSDLIEPFPWED